MGARPDSRFSRPSVGPCGRAPDFGARDPDGVAGAERVKSCRKRGADRGRGSAGGPCGADLRRACRRTGLWVLGRAHRAGAGAGAFLERHGAGCQSARERQFRGRRSRGFQRCAEVRAGGVRRRVRAACRRRILRSGGVHGSVRHTGVEDGCGIEASRHEPVGAGMIPRVFDLTLAGAAGSGAMPAHSSGGLRQPRLGIWLAQVSDLERSVSKTTRRLQDIEPAARQVSSAAPASKGAMAKALRLGPAGMGEAVN